MNKFILAIDDSPWRYDFFTTLTPTVRGACLECVSLHINKASGILLDYDLDGEEECICGIPLTGPHKSTAYLNLIKQRKLPTIITSRSQFQNREYLFEQLKEHVPVIQIPAQEVYCEYAWLGWLYRNKAL